MVTEEFKKILDEDIKRCKEISNSNDREKLKRLFKLLRSKYNKIIDGFDENIINAYDDPKGEKFLTNIDIFCQKLELFKAMGYENKYSEKDASFKIDNSNQNQIINCINISFDAAKEAVEGMSTLKESEIQEILEKISELEKITASSDRKTQKWEHAKDIVMWMADKSVDVGLTLLPLLLKIN